MSLASEILEELSTIYKVNLKGFRTSELFLNEQEMVAGMVSIDRK